VSIGNNHTTIIRHGGRLPGFVVHNLRFQQDQVAGVSVRRK
jgi:hypothetical protein